MLSGMGEGRGTVRENRAKPLLGPIPETVSLLTGIMLNKVAGKGEDGFVTK